MKLGKAWYVACAMMALATATPAEAVYWTIFNQEGTSGDTPVYVTYATFDDMASNSNAQVIQLSYPFDPASPSEPLLNSKNRISSGYDGIRYWTVFNQEGASGDTPVYVTYATFDDMASNSNAQVIQLSYPFDPASPSEPLLNSKNRIDSGYDGIRYWTIFNQEGSNSDTPVYVTYATFDDMASNSNAQVIQLSYPFDPASPSEPLLNSKNRISSGYDGIRYWTIFNQEGTNADTPVYVTYATFDDMASNSNAQVIQLSYPFDPASPSEPLLNSRNRISSGSDFFPHANAAAVPEPATWLTAVVGFGIVGGAQRRRRRMAHV